MPKHTQLALAVITILDCFDSAVDAEELVIAGNDLS